MGDWQPEQKAQVGGIDASISGAFRSPDHAVSAAVPAALFVRARSCTARASAARCLPPRLHLGCATLPEVHPWVDRARHARRRRSSARAGRSARSAAAAILARLRQGRRPISSRATSRSRRKSPARRSRSATPRRCSYDGPAFYRAMFDAIERARDHVNVEFYIIEDDEVGRRVRRRCCCARRRRALSVNLMYDSVGCSETPPAFFERLRAGGVKVARVQPGQSAEGARAAGA